MAHLYLSPDTDSVYLDVTDGNASPSRMAEAADGVYLHVDAQGVVVAIEVMDVGRRGLGVEASEMGHVHVNPRTDSLYLDISAGTRQPVNSLQIAEGVHLHLDESGSLVAIEVLGIGERGGLLVDDLDAMPGEPRPSMFEEIQRATARRTT